MEGSLQNILRGFYVYLGIFFLSLFITSCVHFNGKIIEREVLLPDPGNLPCCWQVTEKLEIKSNSKVIALSSVTVIIDNKLVVVILDSFGMKLLDISQTGRHVKVEKEIEMTKELPIKWLLLGIFLRDMPDSGWSFIGSNWIVKRSGDKKTLNQKNRIIISMTEEPAQQEKSLDNLSENSLISNFHYHDLNLDVKITRLEKKRL